MDESKASEETDSLGDLIEARAQKLLEILNRPHTASELESEAAALKEEILALEAWIEDRSELLCEALAERSEKIRHLMRIKQSDEDLQLEHRKMGALKREIDSLNELRQVLVLKQALLKKIGDGETGHTS